MFSIVAAHTIFFGRGWFHLTITHDYGSHFSSIFTARNSSCGKVMFSQACVKNSVHREGGGGGGVSQHALPGRMTSTI